MSACRWYAIYFLSLLQMHTVLSVLFLPTSLHAQCTVNPRLQAKPCAGSTSVSYCWCLKLLALMHRFQLFPGQLCHFTTGECVCPEQWYHCLHPVCLAYGGCGHCHLALPLWSPRKGNTTAQGSWLCCYPFPRPALYKVACAVLCCVVDPGVVDF